MAASADGAVVFHATNVEDDTGHVRVDLCTQATFLKSDCPYAGEAPAKKGVTDVRIPDVPPGMYAAQVYHDRNDNHTVDRARLIGLPLERVGFSNDAPVGLRGPRWSKARFTHDAADQELTVTLRHYP